MRFGTRFGFTLTLVAMGLAANKFNVVAQTPTGETASRSTPASGATGQTEKEIADLERRWDEAFRARDTEAVSRLLADDFVFLSPFEARWNANKAAYLKNFAEMKASDKGVTVSHELTDTTVNVSGDTAIASARTTITRNGSQGEWKERGRFIHVWHKRNGQWRVVADHWDGEGIVPAAIKPAAADNAILDTYTGTYDAGWPGNRLSVTRTADGLFFKGEAEGGWTETFLAASPTEFFGKSAPDTRAIFVRGDGGQVTEVIVIFYGRATRGRKVAPAS